MAKNLKLNIKNTQLAKAAGLDKLKAKLAGETEDDKDKKKEKPKAKPAQPQPQESEEQKPRRIRAKSKSSFAPEEVSEQNETSSPIPVEEPVAPISEEVEPEEIKVQEAPVMETPPSTPEQAIPKQVSPPPPSPEQAAPKPEPYTRLGPTGRHVKDLLPKTQPKPVEKRVEKPREEKPAEVKAGTTAAADTSDKKGDLKKGKKVKDFKDLKPKRQEVKSFDARDRQGLSEDDDRWRKKRGMKQVSYKEEQVIRPTSLKIRLPIVLKDLAAEMKLKASELIQKLFIHSMTFTLNDVLDDETIVQFIGNEFGCEITIDTAEEQKIQITKQTIREEINSTDPTLLNLRPPVAAFMGHVDHGKTSLIDAIRKSNIVAGEAGAITQHIGAFKCKTAAGELTVLDTPGHEAFSAMRARGAELTDIVVLVVAGDEGLREQTIEAIQHAKAAGVTIVVAINKSDKPNFNPENVYRQLSEINLLPEAWGGQTITVNTSAVTGQGIPELLEMLALQAEVLELKANPLARARGTVLESEMHKGLGCVATILIQNGTLHHGDALVFERHWGKIKTMKDEHGNDLKEAGPSTPVEVTGLSGLPAAGDPFIVVKSEKEAREIAEAREVGREQRALQQKKPSLEKLLQKGVGEKKVLKLILRADVQGSVEALRTSIMKVESDKVDCEVVFMGVGEISESDIQLAAASNAVIIGFHTRIESHAEPLIKQLGVTVRSFDVIYHAIDDVKLLMQGLLDKIAQEKDTGAAEVKQTFKASQLGVIAGCIITEGAIQRNNRVRLVRDGAVIWKGGISSLKRLKEDVREVKKGFECGILLDGYNEMKAGDIIQAYEIIYLTQEI